MSFKREGDDKSQLNILQKRRVADLLSHFIPEDEAALMRNGRYTCVVCSYRPVFDTVDTLTAHRNGKRHLEGLKAFYGKKARLKNERTKRLHEHYVQAEDTRQEPSCSAPLLAQTRRLTRHALLKTVPYNSRHAKTSTKSEKGPLGAGSETGLNSSGKTVSEQEKARRQTEGSNRLTQSTSAADEGSRPSEDRTGANGAAAQEAEPITAERRSELEHYLKLKSDGWLKDRSGRWVRDRNVEFDSDEEEPPSLAPPLPPGP
ncbi:sodium channel modifier 1 isoform X1 [Pseudoliparis swirei]|uniref:sodium channel modifier 1 isoform X1 n=1 Tax=Pseudoliparis swirei TaxID=2059687 RepID=UPI0024BD9FC4|nr:sodium channel modifier 1 isoform X1 [Pseudoliparis swirei]